jgi:hypothetical protein
MMIYWLPGESGTAASAPKAGDCFQSKEERTKGYAFSILRKEERTDGQ